jgi:hypothetical protein
VIQFLEAAKSLVPFTVHLFKAPSGAAHPFVVLWADGGWEFSGDTPGWDASLQDDPDSLELNIRATYSGLTKESVGVLLTRTRAVLNRATLDVPGWYCNRLVQSPVLGIDSDESVQLQHGHPFYAVDEFRLIATKEG